MDRLRRPILSIFGGHAHFVNGYDDTQQLEAFLDAVRWGAATNADRGFLQAPFRSGVSIEEFQLDPLVRATYPADRRGRPGAGRETTSEAHRTQWCTEWYGLPDASTVWFLGTLHGRIEPPPYGRDTPHHLQGLHSKKVAPKKKTATRKKRRPAKVYEIPSYSERDIPKAAEPPSPQMDIFHEEEEE